MLWLKVVSEHNTASKSYIYNVFKGGGLAQLAGGPGEPRILVCDRQFWTIQL
jgi:hypothetical protein